ncbi:hypothetical protein D3C81_1535900 [compost metagenome]
MQALLALADTHHDRRHQHGQAAGEQRQAYHRDVAQEGAPEADALTIDAHNLGTHGHLAEAGHVAGGLHPAEVDGRHQDADGVIEDVEGDQCTGTGHFRLGHTHQAHSHHQCQRNQQRVRGDAGNQAVDGRGGKAAQETGVDDVTTGHHVIRIGTDAARCGIRRVHAGGGQDGRFRRGAVLDGGVITA